MNYEKIRMDGRTNGNCLVTNIGQLETKMSSIFPGYFYDDPASHVIQVSATFNTGTIIVQVGCLRATNEVELDKFLRDDANVDELFKLIPTPKIDKYLVDYRRGKVIEPATIFFTSTPREPGSILFWSTAKQEYFSFDFPGWIATTCNTIARHCAPPTPTVPGTVTGKQLVAVLVDTYQSLGEINKDSDLSWINSVLVPNGAEMYVTPESIFPIGSLAALKKFAEKNKAKFQKNNTEIPTVQMISLLNLINTNVGIPTGLFNYSVNNPQKQIDVKVDTLQDVIHSAHLKSGVIYIKAIKDTDRLIETCSNIFKVDHVVISQI